MKWPTRAVMSISIILMCTAVAAADQWNDKTMLKFDAPMIIPGATLAPGSYVFKLLDSPTDRHVVQIFDQDDNRLMATTHAVPLKRAEPTGDVVLTLNPTEGGPAAIKAWFYPGSLYGHEFVYPDAEARGIAQRTKTLVLSGDVSGSDLRGGKMHLYDANGATEPWTPDETTLKEWDRWTADRGRATASVGQPGSAGNRESTVPMVQSRPAGMSVSIDDLERQPTRYVGQTIHVSGEVEDVFGPRLFKIDEQDWADLDGEVLVYLPSDLAALVRDGDRVTVTGTMRRFAAAEFERTMPWLVRDRAADLPFATRPALEASRIVGGNSNTALVIAVAPKAGGERPVGTSGTNTGAASVPLTAASVIAGGDDSLVGRRVDLDGVTIARPAGAHGFWIDGGATDVYVLAAQPSAPSHAVAVGGKISLEGVILAMPADMRSGRGVPADGNDSIYIYATQLQ